MPSENWRRPFATVPLSELVDVGGAHRPDEVLISSVSWQACGADHVGLQTGAVGSAVWPSANRAIYVPFEIGQPFLAQKMAWANGTVVGTNSLDAGIYDEAGTRLVSSGGTLSAGASTLQEVDITDTLLRPGQRYYMALAMNGTTATVLRWAPAHLNIIRLMGAFDQDTAYTLPSPFVPDAMSAAFFPLFGVAGRVLV
jgi:hypothetical protein